MSAALSLKRSKNSLAEGIGEIFFRDGLGDLLGDFHIDDRESDEGALQFHGHCSMPPFANECCIIFGE
jgi:hypothetical protein